MSKLAELAKTMEYCNVPIPSIRRHIDTVEAIADAMQAGPSKIECGMENFSLTFDFGRHRRIRVICAKRDKASRMYTYQHVRDDQYEAVFEIKSPDRSRIEQAFRWLYDYPMTPYKKPAPASEVQA